MEVSKDWLQVILARRANEAVISKVLSIESEPFVGVGDNYCSIIFRTKVTGILANGKTTKRSVVIKRLPAPGKDNEIVRYFGFFETENFVYSSIFPEIEFLINDFGDFHGLHWAQGVHISPNELIFEDLKADGFSSIPKGSSFNKDQTEIILWSLARLHALSFIAVQEGKIKLDRLGSYIMGRHEDPVNRKFIERGMTCVISAIRKLWGPGWSKVADRLEALTENLCSKLHELTLIGANRFNVLNHGDSWSSNILLKYSPVTGKPIHVKFVDFQMTHYNSYAFDLFYFLYSSVNADIREKEMDAVLSKYREGLMSTFSFYNIEPHNLPSLEDIKNELGRLSLVTLVTSCTVFPLTMSDPEEFVNLSEAWSENEEIPKPYKGKTFTGFLQRFLTLYFN